MSRSKRILIVDDHDDCRRGLAILLRRGGFEVVAYDRCAAAEEHLAADDIDVALLDVRMPDRCGDDFGRELRRRCPRAKIVFITAEAKLEPIKEAVPDCTILRKPLNFDLLLELLHASASERERERAGGEDTDDRAEPRDSRIDRD